MRKIKRIGKCVTCKAPTSEIKGFDENVDMFEPKRRQGITGELKRQLDEWRESDLFCEEHRYV